MKQQEKVLQDLLKFSQTELKNIKIRFNQYNGKYHPIDLFCKNKDTINNQWFLWRTKKRCFQPGQIALCLVKLSREEWLLTTIKKITKRLDIQDAVGYEAE